MSEKESYNHTYFFGESAPYNNDEERDKARLYLELWKDNLLKKLKKDCYKANVTHEQYTTSANIYISLDSTVYVVSLRIAVEIQFKFQVENFTIDY